MFIVITRIYISAIFRLKEQLADSQKLMRDATIQNIMKTDKTCRKMTGIYYTYLEMKYR